MEQEDNISAIINKQYALYGADPELNTDAIISQFNTHEDDNLQELLTNADLPDLKLVQEWWQNNVKTREELQNNYCDFFLQFFNGRGLRIGVGLFHKGSYATRNRCPAFRGDSALMGKPRLPKMNLIINDTWQ